MTDTAYEWEDTVATYCLGFGLQFGFQIFTSRKAPGASSTSEWYPSTTFLTTHTLTSALNDVASRTCTVAAPETPASVAGLRCAVRELHGAIFQPYNTWLKAAKLPPNTRPSHPLPNEESLHIELADLALYWLVYSEAANLRHTPEMLWFIFFCAQRSWQAKQVLSHLKLHKASLAELSKQPWLTALGPGLPRAIRALHTEYRRCLQAAAAPPEGLLEEATLKPLGAALHPVIARMTATTGQHGSGLLKGAAAPLTTGDISGVVAVRVNGTSMGAGGREGPGAEAGRRAKSQSGWGDGEVHPLAEPAFPRVGCAASATISPAPLPPTLPSAASAAAEASSDGNGRIGEGDIVPRLDSPSLPLPPDVPTWPAGRSTQLPTSAFTGPAAAAAAANVAVAGVAVHGAPPSLPGPRAVLTSIASCPSSPVWNPDDPVGSYRELLLRFCPNGTAVASALCDGGGDGERPEVGGNAFLTRVVQPLFLFLTEQVYELGQAKRQGLESALRIGYDDVSESMAHPRIVAAALAALPWASSTASTVAFAAPSGTPVAERGLPEARANKGSGGGASRTATATAAATAAGRRSAHDAPLQPPRPQQKQQQQHPASHRPQLMPRAAMLDEELYWSRLLALGDLPACETSRIPWQGDMAHYRQQLLRLLRDDEGRPQQPATAAASAFPGSAGRSAGRLGPGAAARGRPVGQRTAGGAADSDTDSDDGEDKGPRGDGEARSNCTSEMTAQSVSPEAAAELSSLRRANAAAEWWARHVLRKTFVEHRSLAMPLVAFSRIYQFQLCWFYLLCVWAWSHPDHLMQRVAAVSALHWGSNCLVWTMQAYLSTGPRTKRGNAVIPFYTSKQGRPSARGDSAPEAPRVMYDWIWWLVQLLLLACCWVVLAVGLYISFIVWPHHDLAGLQCYPLSAGRSCYWWIVVVYAALVFSYEVLYRQFNLGGYARRHLYDLILQLAPGRGGGTAFSSTSASPLYNPAAHLRTGLLYVVGNSVLWGWALALKFVIDYFVIIRPAGPRLREIMATDKLAWHLHIGWGGWPEGWSRGYVIDLDWCLAAVQVVVLFLLSLVSSGVAYSVACAVWGAVQGVYQGLGSVRHWYHIRAGFHKVQAAMRAKLLTTEDSWTPPSGCWLLLAAARTLFIAVMAVVLLPLTCLVGVLRWSSCMRRRSVDSPRGWVQREETLSITAPFWNAVVRSLRGRDLLSDREAAALSFTAVALSPAAMMATWRPHRGRTGSQRSQRGGGQQGRGSTGASDGRSGSMDRSGHPRETYLPPVAVYVAQIPQLISNGSRPTTEQLDVLQEAYLYLLHLLVAVGAIPRSEPEPQTDDISTTPPPPAPAGAGPHQGGAAVGASGPPTPTATTAGMTLCPDLHKDSFHPEKFVGMSLHAPSHRAMVARRELLGAVVTLVRALGEAGKTFKDTAGPSTGGGGDAAAPLAAAMTPAATAARNRAVDKLCMTLHAVARCMTKMDDLPWGISLIVNRVVGRQYYHQPAIKAALRRGLGSLAASNRQSSTWGAEHLPSYDDFAKVSQWLLAILRPTDEGTAPANGEALALLTDFCSGLLHPGLPVAPRVEAMRSVTTLIPHYQETVLYALSSADARRVLERAGGTVLEGSLPDDEVLFKNDEGAPTELLQYLLSEFPDEFRNLLERCRTLVPLTKDEPPYTLDDFLPYGRLYEHRALLLLWASFRGQVLARTVDGMSMYRTALAMQAVQDALTSTGSKGWRGRNGASGGHQQQHAAGGAALKLSGVQRMMVHGIMQDSSLAVEELVAQLVDVVPGLGALLEAKYGLVVSSQVYARMAGARGLADRWRAHGIALLATRYETLRVAYLEQDGDPLTLFTAPDFTYRIAHQHSVLLRAVTRDSEVEARKRARVERAAAAAAVAAAEASQAALYGMAGQLSPAPPSPRSVVLGAEVDILGAALDAVGSDSEMEEEQEDEEGGGDGGGAALRVWRRRHCLKHLKAAELEVLFRQQLPVNYYDRNASGVGVILGEGKPENQNTAVPYCPGVLLQTIDMNQDNSLAQAFKLRNTTREFEPLGPGPQEQQVAVLGYPEWIFSYRCGLLADLAASTERTFGTQIQRVMAFPSAVRAHYGHPDLWNRLFSMTRGGVSKANAVQHVSEDVFGGYNALKRGGLSKYVSYISVGKGRDMGLDSILGFEGKISKGCAEQLMSRDVRLLGCHTDFFRSLSLYFSVPGHFINTWLTVLSIRLGVWVQLLLLLAGVGKSNGSISSAMGAVQILQLGTMPLLGYLFNQWMECGLAAALAALARQFVAGGLLFHIFRSVTSAFHLGRAVLFGGASYVATGRGFSLRRKTFTQVYANYGRSHLYLGADILLMSILILVVGNNGGNAMPIPVVALWSPLLVAAALLAGPFWFTPYFFRLNQVLRDWREFSAWVTGSAARGVAESWSEWNSFQLSALRDDSDAQVPRYRIWSTSAIVIPRAVVATLSAIVAITGARFGTPSVPDVVLVLGGSAAAWTLLMMLSITRHSYMSSGLAVGWRWAKGLVQVAVLAAVAALAAVCLFMSRKGLRFSGVLITLYANYQVTSLLVCVAVMWLPKTMFARSLANATYRQTDGVLGAALCAVLVIICFVGEIGLIMLDKVQTLVQFNDRYSHSMAARPYAGEDDLALAATTGAGGGGGGGGGGLAAAAAAALRRRLPSHAVLASLTPGGRGGRRLTGEGGVSTALAVPSGPPSAAQGWVSPRYWGGGEGTPVLMFSGGGATAAAALRVHTAAPQPQPVFDGWSALATNTTTTRTAATVALPAALAAGNSRPPISRGTASSALVNGDMARSGSPPTSLPAVTTAAMTSTTQNHLVVAAPRTEVQQRQESVPNAHAAAGRSSGGGGSGDPYVAASSAPPPTGSRGTSWGSGTAVPITMVPPQPHSSIGSSQGSSIRSRGHVDDGSVSPSSYGADRPRGRRPQLPAAEEWHNLAVGAAEAAVARGGTDASNVPATSRRQLPAQEGTEEGASAPRLMPIAQALEFLPKVSDFNVPELSVSLEAALPMKQEVRTAVVSASDYSPACGSTTMAGVPASRFASYRPAAVAVVTRDSVIPAFGRQMASGCPSPGAASRAALHRVDAAAAIELGLVGERMTGRFGSGGGGGGGTGSTGGAAGSGGSKPT